MFHDSAPIETMHGRLAKSPTSSTSSAALRGQSSDPQSRPPNSLAQNKDGKESDDALATLREDFRASEAVFGLTAL